MTTPLQQAARELLDKYATNSTSIPVYMFGELRKALDAELAQSVEPEQEFYGSEPWEHPNPVAIAWRVSFNRGQSWTLYEQRPKQSDVMTIVPLYLHPPQPQATTPVPDGYVLVPIEPTPKMVDSTWHDKLVGMSDDARNARIRIYKAMVKAAQGEKP